MVKGISRQVIVVQSPDQKLFDQAIFILKEDALGSGVTDDALLKEAQRILNSGGIRAGAAVNYGPLWAVGGAMLTGVAWLLFCLL